MTRSYRAEKERSKSAAMLGATSKVKKDGAGKHSWGNERDEIVDGITGAHDGTAMASSPPNGGAEFLKITTKPSP